MSSIHRSGKRVVVAVIELVALGCHSSMSHDYIGIFVQAQMYLMSGKRTLENRHFAVMVKGKASSVGSALLAFLGKNTKQLLTLLRIEVMIIVYQPMSV
mgnify:CR=1 FL=1